MADYLVCGVPIVIGAFQVGDGLTAHRSTMDQDESKDMAEWRRKRAIDMALGCAMVSVLLVLLISIRLRWVAFTAMAVPTFMTGFYVMSLLLPSGNDTDIRVPKCCSNRYIPKVLRENEMDK